MQQFTIHLTFTVNFLFYNFFFQLDNFVKYIFIVICSPFVNISLNTKFYIFAYYSNFNYILYRIFSCFLTHTRMQIFEYFLALKVPSLSDHVMVNHFIAKNCIFITYNINIYIPEIM